MYAYENAIIIYYKYKESLAMNILQKEYLATRNKEAIGIGILWGEEERKSIRAK